MSDRQLCTPGLQNDITRATSRAAEATTVSPERERLAVSGLTAECIMSIITSVSHHQKKPKSTLHLCGPTKIAHTIYFQANWEVNAV